MPEINEFLKVTQNQISQNGKLSLHLYLIITFINFTLPSRDSAHAHTLELGRAMRHAAETRCFAEQPQPKSKPENKATNRTQTTVSVGTLQSVRKWQPISPDGSRSQSGSWPGGGLRQPGRHSATAATDCLRMAHSRGEHAPGQSALGPGGGRVCQEGGAEAQLGGSQAQGQLLYAPEDFGHGGATQESAPDAGQLLRGGAVRQCLESLDQVGGIPRIPYPVSRGLID